MISVIKTLFNNLEVSMNNINEIDQRLVENSYIIENKLNKLHYELKKEHLKSIENKEYKIKSGIIYADLLTSLETVGNHITEINNNLLDTFSKK